MEGVDRISELRDEILVNNIMSRLDCTTKELIRTTATISKRWKNLWTQLPHLIFSYTDATDYTAHHDYIAFIDNTLNQCPTDLNLKKFKLNFSYCDRVNYMIEKILSGSPCLESLELIDCNGYTRIDVTSKSVKKLVFSNYDSRDPLFEYNVDHITINAPYISSLTLKGKFVLLELVLLDVSSLIKAELGYCIDPSMFDDMTHEEILRGLLESLYHIYSRLKASGYKFGVVPIDG
nr:hypothetical protein [Tanacetum cinerariifolium]